jgi:fructoselysine-6-P-deglycase FrlB-like protein
VNWSCALGKPYDSELDQLPKTYRWALNTSIDPLVTSLRAASSVPLVAVGSGGSFTTAEFAAILHREQTGFLASAQTPMEAVVASLDLRSMAVLVATAGGKNPDVVGAFQHLIVREPRRLLVLCMSRRSPLARLATKYRFVELLEIDLPSGKDGFLATNSLLASVVLLTRAYAEAFGNPDRLPGRLLDLLAPDALGDGTQLVDQYCQPLWQRDTLVVLHSPTTRPAAVDLESKFSEAALGNVRAADYRNFAHGRHYWLAKRPGESAVLAFVTDEDEDLAHRTLAHIPAGIPVVRLKIPFRGPTAGVAALTQALFVVGSAGHARRIDPGRPGVPGFGRKIYHLRAFPGDGVPHPALPEEEEVVAIERKSRKAVAALSRQGQLDFWRDAYATFIRGLARASFRGVVFDYDGTVCDEADRYTGLSPVVGRQLTRLLRAGALLSIATGRGKSVRQALRECIPRKLWERVIVGYYNGGDIGMLHDDARPDGTEQVSGALKPVEELLKRHTLLLQLAGCEWRLPQIKVEPKTGSVAEAVWRLLQQLVYGLAIPDVMVVRSSHSMDVLAPGVSKRGVLDRVAEMLESEKPSAVLCIGDRGQWPGNDFSLLDGPYALSVDEVSEDPGSCWNLAPPGHRGVQATLDYLRRLRPGPAGLRMAVETRTRRRR